MNRILLNYLIFNFLKTVLMWIAIFYCFGVILNLFEEIEFFKKYKCKVLEPLILTSIFYSKLNNSAFTIYNLHIKYVVHAQNKK